jgi:heat shock protein HtpX
MMFHSGLRGGFRSRGGGDRKGGGGAILAILIAVALIALAWFLSVVIRFSLSRKREYLADAGAVELTKNPDAMITALRKIEHRGELEGATSAVMEMCIDNPRSGFVDLFATHPPIDARVDALVRYAGGHDPGPLVLPEPGDASGYEEEAEAHGPWGDEAPSPGGDKPFLPQQPPVTLGDPTSSPPGVPGPWGPHRNG